MNMNMNMIIHRPRFPTGERDGHGASRHRVDPCVAAPWGGGLPLFGRMRGSTKESKNRHSRDLFFCTVHSCALPISHQIKNFLRYKHLGPLPSACLTVGQCHPLRQLHRPVGLGRCVACHQDRHKKDAHYLNVTPPQHLMINNMIFWFAWWEYRVQKLY